MNLQVPQQLGNFFTSWGTISFSRTLVHELNLVLERSHFYSHPYTTDMRLTLNTLKRSFHLNHITTGFKFEPLWWFIERRGRLSSSLLRIQEAALQITVRTPALLTKVFHGFHQSLQVNTCAVPKIKPRPVPFTSFAIRHSLTTLPFYTTQSEQLTASLN